MTPGFKRMLCLAYVASGAISPHRWLKFSAEDGAVAQASADTDKLMGVSLNESTASGERLEVERSGIVPIEYGGNVAAGDFLTSDASGRAIVAAVGDRYGGIAETSGDLGTIGAVFICHGAISA